MRFLYLSDCESIKIIEQCALIKKDNESKFRIVESIYYFAYIQKNAW